MTLQIHCGGCGKKIDSTLRYCNECGTQVPRWDSGGPNSLSHDELLVMIQSFVAKVRRVRGWVNTHGKFVISVLLAILSMLLSYMYYQRREARLHPPPPVIWIEGAKPEVPEGSNLRLTAKTSSHDLVLDKFDWSPPEMFDGNGQQSVTFTTDTKDRHTESRTVWVGVIATDKFGNAYPVTQQVPIKVVPMKQWNHKPDLPLGIHVEGSSSQIRAGTSVMLDALATDQDGDKLFYSWSVGEKRVQIEGEGNPTVTLRIPRDLIRSGFLLMEVDLVVKDGHEDGICQDHKFLTVTRAGGATVSRSRKAASPPLTNGVQQPTPTAPAAPNSNPPAAVPQATQSGAKPVEVSRP